MRTERAKRRLALGAGLLLLGIGVVLQVMASLRNPDRDKDLGDILRALENEGGDAAARALVDVARKYPERAGDAALRLSRLDGRRAPGALLEILADRDTDPRLRAAAARALGRARLLSASGALAAHAVADNIEIRVASLEALGLLGDPQAAAVVAPALEDPDPQIRRAAIKALGNLRSEVSTKALEGFLARVPPPEAGEAALARRSLAVLRGEEPSKRF